MKGEYPVVVASGQVTLHPEEIDSSVHALQVAALAAGKCAEDSGDPSILRRVDSLTLVNMFSGSYEDPAGEFCGMLGIRPSIREYTAIGGNTPQWLVNRAADRIARGEISMALLAGAEAMTSLPRNRKENWLNPPSEEEMASLGMVGDTRWGSDSHEMLHGLHYPIQAYPLFENALRARWGMSLREHRSFLARYCHHLSIVAAGNPLAWFRTPRSLDELEEDSLENRIIGFPYTKRMNPIMQVNQGAAVLVTGAATARRLSIPEERWVYLHGGADRTEAWFLSQRQDFHSSPAAREVGREALRMAGKSPEDIDFFDLYSCFPSATVLQALELGFSRETLPACSITGGLPYFGGPGNNYTMHAIGHAVERCRREPESFGYVSAMGWYLTKFSAGVYSCRQPLKPWNRRDGAVPNNQTGATAGPALEMIPRGPVVVETYTVMHDRGGEPVSALVVGRLPDGKRCWANTERDADLFRAMESEEFVGRQGCVRPGNGSSPNRIRF